MKRRQVVWQWSAPVALALILYMIAPVFAVPPDIVLYASDVTSTQGNWTSTSGAAAGGQYEASADLGWSTTGSPLASPTDYFEMTFNASANTPYHVWLR